MAFADRGNAFVDLHQYYRAISDFGEAIRLRDSLDSTLLEKRADAYLAARDERAAVDDYTDDYTDAIALTLQREITMLPTAQYQALYPEYSGLSEAAFLQVA